MDRRDFIKDMAMAMAAIPVLSSPLAALAGEKTNVINSNNMKKIIIIDGGPRKNMNTAAMLEKCAEGARLGFRLMQFNAVVAANVHALHLYERLGFTQLGRIPQGFLMKDGHYEDIILLYIEL